MIYSDNGLSSVQWHTIMQTNASLTETLETNVSKILIKIQKFY